MVEVQVPTVVGEFSVAVAGETKYLVVVVDTEPLVAVEVQAVVLPMQVFKAEIQ
jgi:hypothetical protein